MDHHVLHTTEALLALGAGKWELLQVDTTNVLSKVAFHQELLAAVRTPPHLAIVLLMHNTYVLVHVVLDVEAFSTLLADVPVITVDVHMPSEPAFRQEHLPALSACEHLRSLVHTVDVIPEPTSICELNITLGTSDLLCIHAVPLSYVLFQ